MSKKRQLDDWTSEDIGNPVYSRQSHRSVDQKARDDRFREELQQQKNDNFQNVIAPAVETALDFSPIIGDIKSGYEAASEAEKGNYVNATLAALGILPFIPSFNKVSKVYSKAGDSVVRSLKDKGETIVGDLINTVMTPRRLYRMSKWYDFEKDTNKGRKLSEMFPVMAADVEKADRLSGDAVVRGVNYVDEYYKNPAVKAKVEKIIKDNGRDMPEARKKVLREKGIMDADGNVDVDKYLKESPTEVGDIFSLDEEMGGYHIPIEDGGNTVIHDRALLYRRNPKYVESTAAHERNHVYQEVLGFDSMDVINPETKYWRANPNHTIGNMLSEVANKKPKDNWFQSAQDLHSFLIEYKKAKKIAPDAVIDDKLLDKMLDFPKMAEFFTITEENKPKIKKLLNALPSIAPAAALSYASQGDQEFADGGTVGDADYDIAYDYLVNTRNIKPVQAVAIISNLDRESGMNPDIENSIGAYGIQQWLGPRKENLFKRYGKSPNLLQQLEYLVDEHEGKVKGSGWNFINKGKNLNTDRFNYYMYSKSDFDNATSVSDAIIAWNQGFGRPATHELNNESRIKVGSKLAQRYGVDSGTFSYMMDTPVPEKEIVEVETPEREYKGVASYVPAEKEEKVVVVEKDEDEVESPYAKKLREKDEAIKKKRMEDKQKMDFFNTVWNGITLRPRKK